ncbi:18S rRNA biogenesis protein [Ramicandelaber brevisporus]|nr:18S rRNA biogenesis protein [Ramicandelaber brevisporus]
MLRYTGHNYLRQRLVFATLSGQPVRIDEIRADDDNPGLRDYEVSFLRLLEKATNGSSIDISYTGTTLTYRPGVIIGGRIEHECPLQYRAIGYYLEALIALAPFGKVNMNARLTGITNDNIDVTVDTLRIVTLVHLRKYGIEDGSVELKITKRGSAPLGGGEVTFQCPVVRAVKPIQFFEEGRIKRIRGIAYCTRVSPQNANRMAQAARSVLNHYINQVDITTDVYSGADSGLSPGYGIALVAESTTGVLLSAELCSKKGDVPEDVGVQAARMLLSEIEKGGCFDTCSQWLAMLLVVLGPEDVSRTRVGKLSPFSIQYMRDIRDFFNVTFKLKPDPSNKTVLVSGVGTGYVNTNKKTK